MFDELEKRKALYAGQIENGRKIEAFTSMAEWQWYVETVVKPTIAEYTERIMRGELETDKEDWVMRGMVMGMRLLIETPEEFKTKGEEARKKARALQKAIQDES